METQAISSSAIEAEIAQLSLEIAAKRAQLETSRGVVLEGGSDRAAVHEVLGEKLAPSVPVQTAKATDSSDSKASYLDSLDQETVARVNEYIQKIFQNGIAATIQALASENPFVVDAVHDALTDRVYDELKKRKLVS